ncbi:hypothetical protein P4637_20755 [Halalkalibacterium halodurans]|jgi:hypothetical protein|uniref:BH3188 protein n=2 Tax=Halalkalibacterium halodurans TaxID=86665 RepID=Q9K819_HALH5|nr:hypothetical protein [Halalkalibacterium halodurans]MDY7223721.1 hypothetical protein [Halalkalibacterium halodurans]MDY7242942.1 hypothetical protein [Halalkalibacterium halodurans]MED3647211.1 hypothetical protein [Halalkalibacterium halodurans]MED4083031.1 hypothetical protein [Halalkalibacterium halodurans]MED4087244.1 hypothetical protein [Halalkalibacterium halodurans]
MDYRFEYDSRLGIALPVLSHEWEQYAPALQDAILVEWEQIRGVIPDRVKEIEQQINLYQQQLEVEEDFNRSCELNRQIAELASVINDLWIWFRANQTMPERMHS